MYLRPLFSLVIAVAFALTPSMAGEALGPIQLGSLPVFLLQDHVAAELKLTPRQVARIQALRTEFRDSARRIVDTVHKDPSVSRKEADHAIVNLLQDSNIRAYELLTDRQKIRLGELEVQALGGTILTVPAVQKKLGLNERQIARINQIAEVGREYTSAVNSWYERGSMDHYEKIWFLREGRIRMARKMEKVLTPEQRKAFNTLKGLPLSL